MDGQIFTGLIFYVILFLIGSIMLKFSLPKTVGDSVNLVLFSVGGVLSCFTGACLFIMIIAYTIEFAKKIILP